MVDDNVTKWILLYCQFQTQTHMYLLLIKEMLSDMPHLLLNVGYGASLSNDMHRFGDGGLWAWLVLITWDNPNVVSGLLAKETL